MKKIGRPGAFSRLSEPTTRVLLSPRSVYLFIIRSTEEGVAEVYTYILVLYYYAVSDSWSGMKQTSEGVLTFVWVKKWTSPPMTHEAAAKLPGCSGARCVSKAVCVCV